MSIATELQDLNDNILDAYTAVQGKGGTVPANKNMVNLPTAISSISSGGGVGIPRGVVDVTYSGTTYHEFTIPRTDYAVFALPSGADSLGQYALAYSFAVDYGSSEASQRSLREVDLSNITRVGQNALDNAFNGNKLLESIDISSVKSIGAYGMQYMCNRCSGLTGNIDLSKVTYVNTSGLANAFSYTGITSIDLSSLSGCYLNALEGICYGCTSLVSADLSSLDNVSGLALNKAFYGCTSLTSIDLSSITSFSSSSGSQFSNMCYGCTSLSSVKFPSIAEYALSGAFRYAFYNCSSLSGTLDLSGITKISQETFYYAFCNCTGLTSIDVSDLEEITGSSAFRNAFSGCTGLVGPISFTKLRTTGSNYYTMQEAFSGCTSLTELRFPALTTTSSGHWSNMLQGCTGVTVHFPAAMQSTMGSWSVVTGGFGGTNTTVLFDL